MGATPYKPRAREGYPKKPQDLSPRPQSTNGKLNKLSNYGRQLHAYDLTYRFFSNILKPHLFIKRVDPKITGINAARRHGSAPERTVTIDTITAYLKESWCNYERTERMHVG